MVDTLDAHAIPLTPFRYEAQAQRYCPADTVVWLNFRKRTYYSRGQKHYARGLDGSFVCRNEARDSGYRRSDYSTIGVANTYKFEVQYAPVADYRFRASYDRAIRAPVWTCSSRGRTYGIASRNPLMQ